MARGWNACVLLVLAASALLTVSADYYTDEQIAGMIASNCYYTAGEAAPAGAPTGTSHGLTHDQCATCIGSFSTPSSTVEDGNKIEACFNLCQDPLSQLPALPNLTPDASKCTACLAAAPRENCRSCMALSSGADATACIDYWIAPAASHSYANASVVEEPAFVWAVAECHKYTTANGVRANCLACLAAYEWDVDVQTQYFGKCIDAQQQAQYIAQGDWDKVNGIYAMCGVDTYVNGDGIDSAQCYTCMLQVQDAFKDQVQDPILGPQLQRKPYGCAEYCMTESTPLAAATDGDYATRCTQCLAATTPADAWACGNCAGLATTSKDDCFDCIADDPYEGHTSNFNWACAECSKIQNAQLRTLCLQCIRSQPAYAPKPAEGTLPTDQSYVDYLAFIQHTEANICSCVDLTFHAGSAINSHPGVATISVNRTLDAFELKCFMPQYTYGADNVLDTPTIPWGSDILPYYGADGTTVYIGGANGEPVLCPGCTVNGGPNPAYGGINYAPTTACVQCVDSTYRVSAPQYPKQYACSEYCQDPATIWPTYTATVPLPIGNGVASEVSEGQDCSDCVTDARVVDPSDCKSCITATNSITDPDERALRRQECFFYVRSPRVAPPAAPAGGKRSLLQTTAGWPNFGWAAGQCAQFSNTVARAYCYACLLDGCQDPCDCVDAARRANGTAYASTCNENPPPPGDTPCGPEYIWFWTWVPQACDSGCVNAAGDITPANWYSRSISQFNWRIRQRTMPNAGGCISGGGGPPVTACGWVNTFPASGSVPVLGSNVHAFKIASQLSDPVNDLFYDVFAVRIDISNVPFPAACVGSSAPECQFFLVLSGAEAVTPAGRGTTAPDEAADFQDDVRNYTPFPMSWDDSQTTTPNSGYQNSASPWKPYNGIAIEVDACDGQLLYTSLSPYPTTSNLASLFQGGPDGTAADITVNTVYRMFSINHTPVDHPPNEAAHPPTK